MLELSRELGDKGDVATALNSLGTIAVQQGNSEQARALLQENMGVLEELEEEGSPDTTLKRFHALNLLGYLAIYEDDDYAGGTALWEESLALAREIGDPNEVGIMLSNLGHPALLQGEYERARELSEEALAFARELGSSGVELIPTASINLGLALLSLGEHERAAAPFEEALVMSEEPGGTAAVERQELDVYHRKQIGFGWYEARDIKGRSAEQTPALWPFLLFTESHEAVPPVFGLQRFSKWLIPHQADKQLKC